MPPIEGKKGGKGERERASARVSLVQIVGLLACLSVATSEVVIVEQMSGFSMKFDLHPC